MSSDLLAEFDSFYRTPQVNTANDAQAKPAAQSTSASDDLSFLEAPSSQPGNPNHSKSQWNIFVPKPSDEMGATIKRTALGNHVHATTSATDPWGSFQPPSNTTSTGQQAVGCTETNHEGTHKAETWSSKPHIIRRPTIDLFSSSIIDFRGSNPTRQQSEVAPGHASTGIPLQFASTSILSNKNGNILFDAASELNREDEDEDFGDFETVSSPQIDLLDIGSSPLKAGKTMKKPNELLMTHESLKASPFPYPQAPKSPSFRERNPFADLAVTTPSIPSTTKKEESKADSPVTAWPEYESKIPTAGPYHDSQPLDDLEEADWGDFEDLPAETTDTILPRTGIEAHARAWDAVDSHPATTSNSSMELGPATNIPPPSVLLSIFPQLFDLPQSSLFQPVAHQSFTLKNRILSDPSTIDFLRAYVLLATVAARIIAGRKLRWKRDTNLSQAMKIGPAASHGKGGMKLTGVDKTELIREEREATDIVRIWREQVGRLRSAVAAANSSLRDQSANLVVPEIAEAMTIKVEGVLTAPRSCVVCGLKREERILKVDFQVEDSFGEWWVEHWGHRACRNFWQEHERKLKQR